MKVIPNRKLEFLQNSIYLKLSSLYNKGERVKASITLKSHNSNSLKITAQ